MKTRAKIKLEGVVQGVGFRPFVHRLSNEHLLSGFIQNTSAGVDIEAEGEKDNIRLFYAELTEKLPPLARITGKRITFAPTKGFQDFSIRESATTAATSALVSPDIGTCEKCRQELFDPADRRYRYPFINCTDCGPRFSIIEGLPYDRRLTTMTEFRMCPQCREEYRAIASRRYHAQPNACSLCGPKAVLLKKRKRIAEGDSAVRQAAQLLRDGAIIAVKGIGGFHIACDGLNRETVKRLREKKHRAHKPLAVMAADIATIRKFCSLPELEEQLLFSPERPIVLLRKLRPAGLTWLSPDNNYLGVMAPYSPLHYLLCAPGSLLVMTSGNMADEPVEISNESAMAQLGKVCDYFLLHDRRIANRCDDSIVQAMDGKAAVLRRGRGYSPFPFLLEQPARRIFACGAELKSTFCLCKGRFAFLSQYIGDLKTYASFEFYTEAAAKLCRLFRIKPEIIACDLHPDYLSTGYAREQKKRTPSLQLIALQHHEAHAASVIAEHSVKGRVIAACFDGTGFGTDGTAWGGEFFAGSLKKMVRAAALECAAMPGGDKATQEPYRMGISCLYAAYGESMKKLNIDFVNKHRAKIAPLLAIMRAAPLTSSCGRLFDAVSSILGICDIITYEAQAAIRLQMHAERSRTRAAYRFDIAGGNPARITTGRMFRELTRDIERGIGADDCARKFHNGLARATAQTCAMLRRQNGINTACLSGGVFQNRLLLETTLRLLRKNGFTVYFNQLVAANDGAVSLGQVVLADARV